MPSAVFNSFARTQSEEEPDAERPICKVSDWPEKAADDEENMKIDTVSAKEPYRPWIEDITD